MQRVVATLVILLVLALGGHVLRRAHFAPPTANTSTEPATAALLRVPSPQSPSPLPATASATPPAPALEPHAPATAPDRGIVGEWTGLPPVSLAEFASKHAFRAPDPTWRLPVRLSADRLVHLVLKTHQTTELEGGVFTGTVENIPGSTAVMSYVGSAQAGVVLIPSEHRSYNFRSGDDGILRVTELDTLNAPDCGNGSG